jgi:hypothetical protein
LSQKSTLTRTAPSGLSGFVLPDDGSVIDAASASVSIGDRRIDRFWRKLYRCIHARRFQHNRHLWPYLSVTRGNDGTVSKAKVFGYDIPLVPIATAIDRNDKTLHLILSGPSVASIEYDTLPIAAAMGVNGSIALARKFDIPFRYYCIIDQSFARERIDLVREVVSRDLILFVTPDVLRYIVQGISPGEYRCRICVIELVSAPTYGAAPAPEALRRLAARHSGLNVFDAENALGYSFDLARGVFDADTVAYVALQILVGCGVQTIYMHGLDLGDAKQQRFYGEGTKVQSSRLSRNYKRLIEPSFAQAAPLLRAHGIKLFNLSRQSALSEQIMPKMDWRELC